MTGASILAATAGPSGSVTVPLGMLLTVLGFSLTGMSGFLAWLVKQVTLQSRFQAETSIVLKGLADRASEDRTRVERLEQQVRDQHTRNRAQDRAL